MTDESRLREAIGKMCESASSAQLQASLDVLLPTAEGETQHLRAEVRPSAHPPVLWESTVSVSALLERFLRERNEAWKEGDEVAAKLEQLHRVVTEEVAELRFLIDHHEARREHLGGVVNRLTVALVLS